ncbi:MAG TPA: lysyl oxidase family protein [Archangium sp.]|nr:lysyl oxidase family protein [Archangium sp.]
MRMSQLFVAGALLVMSGACRQEPKPEEPKPGESPVEAVPFLSDTPLWRLEAPESLRASCFGSSIALGDVNGDGHDDLVVAAPPCASLPGKGHVVLYAGNGKSFFSAPVVTQMDWGSDMARGRAMVVSVGNVNGDRFADLFIRASAGGMAVFAGGEDLGKVLQQPLFRLPLDTIYRNGFLSDLDGDGLDDLVAHLGWEATVYRATPGGEAPFTPVRAFPQVVTQLVRAGDTNGDGLGDVLIRNAESSLLFLGCRRDEPEVCQGGLSAMPVWRTDDMVQGFFPDQNGDGRSEVLAGSLGGTVAVHLFQPEGGISPAPIWSLLGDPAFPTFSLPAHFVGDLDKDTQETEFLLSAAGRLYAFFPRKELSAELRPDWAWPRSNAIGPAFEGYVRYSPVRAGDLDGDGYPDFIAGLSRSYDGLAPANVTKPGQVLAFGGGKVPPQADAPFLKAPASCGLAVSSGGKPDVTVDADVLSRTLYVERRDFSETACEVVEGCVGAPGNRRLLRFSVSIPNLGSGEVRIPSPMDREDLYELDKCHGHHHLTGFASYELLGGQGSVVSVGRKQGFYLIDYQSYCGDAAPQNILPDGTQIISPGWADIYAGDYSCQWLDITDLSDGTYTLRVGVDKKDIIDEQDVLPNSVDVKVKIAGESVEVVP